MEPEEIRATLLKFNHTQMAVLFWRLRRTSDLEIERLEGITNGSVWTAAGVIYKAFNIGPGRGDLRWIELLRHIPDLRKYVDEIVPDPSALANYKNRKKSKQEKKPGRKPRIKTEGKQKAPPQPTEESQLGPTQVTKTEPPPQAAESQPVPTQLPKIEPPPPQAKEKQPAPTQAAEKQPGPAQGTQGKPPSVGTPPPGGTEPPTSPIPLTIPRDPGRAIIDLLRRHPMPFLIIIFSIGCLVLVQFIFSHLQPPVQTANNPRPISTSVPLLLPSTLPPTSTITITPTIEPYRSPTPIPTNTPNPNILFFDDFDNGISPAWQVLRGEPITVDGHLPQPASGTLLMVVGDKNWQRIQIDFDYLETGNAEYTEICVRFVDIKNGIYFRVSGDDVGWYMLKDGIKTTIVNSVAVPNPRGPWPWVLVVDGFNYSAYLEFDVVSSINTKAFKSGQVGVQMFSGMHGVIDNFKVSRLP